MPETPHHPFDDALELVPTAEGVWQGRTSAAYANMVGPFGGLTAAVLLRAVESAPDRLGDPVALTVNFAGPVADGEFQVSAEAARTNRATQHWTMTLRQGETVAATATAVFGTHRHSWDHTEASPPPGPNPATLAPAVFPAGIAWPQRYDMRFVEGALPADDAGEHPDSTSTLWVGDRPARPLDFASLAAMCDVFYPRVFLRLGAMVPAGTVSLTVYFHADADEVAAVGSRPLLATARSQRFSGGYFDQSASLWGSAGTLLATSHQIVYFKA